MERKKVRLGISAKQYEMSDPFDAEPVKINVICDGVITEEDGKINIEYEEHLSGGAGVTHTQLVFDKSSPGAISMVRQGEVSSACSFAEGERCSCAYNTDGLTLDFCVVTKSVKNNISLSGGKMGICYDMEVRGITVSRNEYRISVIRN